MDVILWIAQGLLALAFLGAGAMKLATPRDRLMKRLPWAEDVNAPTIKLIGTVEVLGALGLILPRATGIAPVLTPLAAVGLAVVMALAMALHTRRREWNAYPINAVLMAIALFIAWGRFGPYGP